MRLHHSLRVKETLLAKQDGKCGLCGQELCGRIDWDHIIPLALGGPDTPENLQAVHAEGCHSEKTKTDVKRIAKAKRMAGETGQYARRLRNGPQIKSRGFQTTLRKKMNGTIEVRSK